MEKLETVRRELLNLLLRGLLLRGLTMQNWINSVIDTSNFHNTQEIISKNVELKIQRWILNVGKLIYLLHLTNSVKKIYYSCFFRSSLFWSPSTQVEELGTSSLVQVSLIIITSSWAEFNIDLFETPDAFLRLIGALFFRKVSFISRHSKMSYSCWEISSCFSFRFNSAKFWIISLGGQTQVSLFHSKS